VEDLRRAGVTVVLSTHAMDEAERLADHVVIVAAGRVVAAGTTAELTSGRQPVVTLVTAAGLDTAALAGRLRERLGTQAQVSEQRPGTYAVSGPAGDVGSADLLTAVAAWCAEAGIDPARLAVSTGSLEDVYLSLTGGGR
jgi:ABC-2 type transport system ATP-binding protein